VSPDVYNAIVQMAQANGIDPAYALAIAQRESDFNVHGSSGSPYSSAYGLFQLLKGERAQYGGSSSDPVEQANAWGRYIQPTRDTMETILGRDPSGSELYLGHYFGPSRAARMVNGQIPQDTPVEDVFSRKELAANPNIRRAGTVGRLTSSIQADVDRRAQRFGANPSAGLPDFSQYGEEVPGQEDQAKTWVATNHYSRPDLSQYGEEVPGQQLAEAPPQTPPITAGQQQFKQNLQRVQDPNYQTPNAPQPPPSTYDPVLGIRGDATQAQPQTTRQWNIPSIPFGMGGMVSGQLKAGGVNLPPALEQKINNGDPITEDDLNGLPQGDLDKASTMLKSYTGQPLYNDVPVPQQVAQAVTPQDSQQEFPQQPAGDIVQSPPLSQDLSSFGTEVPGQTGSSGSPNIGGLVSAAMGQMNQPQQGPQFMQTPDYTIQARLLAARLNQNSPWSVPKVPGGQQADALQQQQPEPLQEFEQV
jgi:hypothetical protein